MINLIAVKWSDGASYAGEGQNEVPDGKGIYITADGCAFEGVWKNGFSYGFYRTWLEAELNSDNFNFLTVFDSYFQSVETFIKESAGRTNKCSRNFYDVFATAMNLKFAISLKSYGCELLEEFLSFISGHFASYSNNIYAGLRVYTCGGRFLIPPEFQERAKDLILTIEPFRNFKICFLHLDATLASLKTHMESSIGGRSDSARERIFSDVLKKIG